MARYILEVIGNAHVGREEEANDWYENIHLAEVLAVPGFVSAQRFEPIDHDDSKGPKRYLASYEIEADDPSIPMAALGEAVRTTMNMTDAMDAETFTSVVYRARTEKLVKD